MRRALLILALLSCDGVDAHSGLYEPIRVKNGQFVSGALPPPAPGGPMVTSVIYATRVVLPGAAGKKLDGRVSKTAVTVGLRLADVGTGYWSVIVGGPDGQVPNENTWSAEIDFDLSLRPGSHELLASAIAADGTAGPPSDLTVCVASRVPDNLHSCAPNQPVPDFVATLQWDEDVDLDLEVVSSDGSTISAKHPAPQCKGNQGVACDPNNGAQLDRDSLANCVTDGFRQEDIVAQYVTRDPPMGGSKIPSGTNFDFYVNLFDACGKQSVDWVLTIYRGQGELVPVDVQKGRLIALDANGGSGPMPFVTSYTFP